MKSIKEFMMYGFGLCILGLLLLVSAPNNTPHDVGNSSILNCSDGIIVNLTFTPHRQINDSVGFVEVNLTSNKDTNKSFTLKSNNGESIMKLKGNSSISLNTSVFSIPSNGLNKSYNLTNNNDSVECRVEFVENKPFKPLDFMLPSPYSTIRVNTTIQDAVNNASSGDTVIIPTGTYTGIGNRNININKNLTIVGEGNVIIDGEGSSNRIFYSTSNGIRFNISNLNIKNTISSSNGAIYMSGSSSINVTNCNFTNTTSSYYDGSAIYINKGSNSDKNNSVTDCNFINTHSTGSTTKGGAIFIYGTDGSGIDSVIGCNFTNTYTGCCGGAVYISSSNSMVSDCKFTNATTTTSYINGAGAIHLYDSNNAVINNCIIENGGSYSMGGIGVDRCSNVVINNSVIRNNSVIDRVGGIGVGATGSSDSTNVTIANCNITGNKVISSSNPNAGGVGFNATGDSKIVNCIIANNSASSGGGISIANGNVIGCSIIDNTANNTVGAGGGVYLNGGGNVTNCTITGNKVFSNTNNGVGGGIFGNGLVLNCIVANNTVAGVGGGIFNSIVINSIITGNNATTVGGGVANCTVNNSIIAGNNAGAGGGVADGNVTNCTITGNNGGGILTNSNGIVNYCRIFNNTNYDGFNIGNSSCNIDFNWWGQNNITNLIDGTYPNSYYQIELSAANNSTRDVNKNVSGVVPVGLGYRMVLNDSNNTGNFSYLPDFNATIKLNNNTGLFRSGIGLFGFLPFMMAGDSFDILAKNPWNDTINNAGNYVFSGLVDNQQLNITLFAERMNTSLNLTAANITYGDNTNISATLTDINGTLISNKTINFSINGTNYTAITNVNGVATLNNITLGAGNYSVSAMFAGDGDYNPSTSNNTFSVAKMNTSLNITKTVNSTNPVVGDLITYTINVMNNGTNNINTPILVNDILSSSLEYVNSSANVGSYVPGAGLWTIPSLNNGSSAILNIIVKVKNNEGIVTNTASFLLDNYNNNQTNESSVNVAVAPSNSGGDGNDTNGSDSSSGGNGFGMFGNGLAKTGLPIVLLVLLSISGIYYWRRK
ncbi:MAG: DUF11 domain-containing protein [Methanobrevibacter sp.]|nr:DUF11 domain-containing protein [Candidatus Methanovirga australis]